MINTELAHDIHWLLESEGEVLMQTDVWDVALEVLDIFEALDEHFANRAGPWSFWKDGNPYGVRSNREQACQEAGLPIWRIWYRRKPASP